MSAAATSLPEGLDAGALRLTDAELGMIDAAFPLGARPRELPMI